MRGLPRLDDHEHARIRTAAKAVLHHADAVHVVPTPLDVITASLDLHPVEHLFDFEALPPGLLTRLRRLKNKVLGALAIRERTVYVDLDQQLEKSRFTHGHELGHRVLPGHHDLYYGDDSTTLKPEVLDLLEAEANQFSAELLFQGELFTEMADSNPLGLGIALDLAPRFETSRHAAIRRYAEDSSRACALLVFGHFPIYPDGTPSMKILHTVESQAFRQRFGPIDACLPRALPISGPLGRDVRVALRGGQPPIHKGTFVLPDSRRGTVTMNYEIFSNTYFAFALVYPRSRIRRSGRILVVDTGASSRSA